MSEAPDRTQSFTGTPPWGTGTPPWGSGPPPWLPSATWTSSGSAETSTSSTSANSSPHAHLGAIIGGSVGGGLALVLLGALVYVCRRRRLRKALAQDASAAPFTVPPPPSRAEKTRRDPDVERQASGSCTPGYMSTPPSTQDQELRNVLAHMTARVQVLEEERLGGLQVTNEDPPEYTPPPGTQVSARIVPEKGDWQDGHSR
ncbi:uncharacterized protein SCHCODRAFT_02086296 [Schizophyllum commune H4-8]|uniref:Uncharacterized protein n=1 Tax=Schizophyllum commune (strain H4-8 / FGSC 9210) TaxID=578458 RepID=D8QH21_SCHCM|nr:uncharacterized protein SCHCODRAFT_02086296 [Schizophyllum commune H4-8]KAI5886989.1 hypothetical protein SCHCODRAFT_02086296 [Schizophyllum commune H4-8]